ncbi:MAG: 5-dehydro-2-deoxygluconokinase, partial [Acidobacteria bacterium]|nr:5-dehydro-2-deoxygluconokinase [Acidobacteriota bacterium]
MEVTVLGRIGYDLYSEEPHVPLPQVRRFSRYLGGSSANMAVGLARLGAQVGMVGALGADSLSQFLLDFLRAEKVDTSHVKT